MKLVSLLLSILFSVAVQAGETQTTIYVMCPCTYTIDTLFHSEMAYGQDSNPDESTLESCIIEKGKVIQGCWLAKQRALGYCWDISRRMNPNDLRPNGYIEESQCYGAIEEEEVKD